MWKYILLVCLQQISFCHGETDPCDNATQLPFITQRVVNYTLASDELPLCDRYLKTAWYKMGSFVLANTTDGCGTTYNWFMYDGFLPVNGIANVSVCSWFTYNRHTVQCPDAKSISVKKCGNKYIFLLERMKFCDEAYCITSLDALHKTDAPDISSIRPYVKPQVKEILGKGELIFYCDFDTIPSTSYYYIIEWSQTTGLSTTRLLYRTIAFEYKKNFKENTALTETILRQRGIDSLGFTIMCSVVASKELGSALSHIVFSPQFFCGIEVPRRPIIVEDGQAVPIYLRLTVPFYCKRGACAIHLEMYIPQIDDCSVSEIAHIDNEGVGCGVMFGKEDVGELKQLMITSKFGTKLHNTNDAYGVIFKTVGYRDHTIFGNYAPGIVRVQMVQNTKVLSGIHCYAHSDPHILTFDRESYNNHMDGVFILYRNSGYKTEVQIKTEKCANYYSSAARPMCNCGITIRTGRDVFVLNKCQLPHWDVSFRYCEDRILKRSVKKDPNGRKYTINLPTGTAVTVTIGLFAEIEIHPSLLDKSKVDGLCGNFDNHHVINTLSALKLKEFINGNRVTINNNLFDSNVLRNLASWEEEFFLCTCENNFTYNLFDHVATCKQGDKKKSCKDGPNTNADNFEFCGVERRKREVDGNLNSNRIIDRHTNVQTDFRSINPKQGEGEKMFKRSVFSNDTAYENCISMMNTTAFRMCSNLPTLDLGSYIDNCVYDALASGSMIWTQLHIEKFTQMCVWTVEENQPIPAEILDKIKKLTSSFSFLNNGDDDNLTYTTSSASAGTTNPLSTTDPVFSKSLLEELKSVSCPFDCNGQGKCDGGVCVCEEGYISYDCSIAKNETPIMKGIPDFGLCDLRQRKCLRTSVFGEKFVASKDLSCKLIYLKMDTTGHIQKEDISIQNASLHTFEEVICSLKFEREKRSVSSDIDNYRANGYQVSVSNDGINFSEADVIVIFDSKCVTCNKTNEMFICQTKPGFCQSNGLCYAEGEMFGCYTCSGENTPGLRWTPGSECSMPVQQPDEERSKLWLIGATVGPVVAIVVIVIIVCYVLM